MEWTVTTPSVTAVPGGPSWKSRAKEPLPHARQPFYRSGPGYLRLNTWGVQPGVSLPLPQLERDQFADAQSGIEILPELDYLLQLQRVPRLVADGACLLVPTDDLDRLEGASRDRHRFLSFYRHRVDAPNRSRGRMGGQCARSAFSRLTEAEEILRRHPPKSDEQPETSRETEG